MPCSICKQSGHNRRTCVSIDTKNTIQNSKIRTKSLHSGVSYENKILNILCRLLYAGSPICNIGKTGGSTTNPDLQLIINNNKINIEIKNNGGFEGGGKSMKIINNKLMCPKGTLHYDILGETIPWSGRIPSFMKGDKTIHTWKIEKSSFRDEYHRISSDVISSYYKSKGVHYIQIEGKGLYHTGNDILSLGVPLFECRSRIRIRCKQHRSTSMPSSVQAVFKFDRISLHKSNYDIENKLPNVFTLIS